MSDEDVRQLTFLGQRDRVFRLPSYEKELLEKYYRSGDVNNYKEKKNRAARRQSSSGVDILSQPDKIDSNLRGYALIINNKKFHDEVEFPERRGSDNDVKTMKRIWKQLHYIVEVFENQTKAEMERIVDNFSRKPELYDVDSVILVFMSYKEEGTTEEDTQIMGVDGLGYKTEKIISHFYNDTCKAMIGKPKMFFFQACSPVDDICKMYGLRRALRARGRVP